MESFALKTAPASEPLTLSEAKLHLRVSHAAEDALITALITAARMAAESYTNRQLLPATWYYRLDAFPDDKTIMINRCPATAVASVKYFDADNADQTLNAAKYITDFASEPFRVVLKPTETWPTTYERPGAVVIEFTAGYANAAAVPAPIKAAMLLAIGHLYEHREAVVQGVSVNEMPMGVTALLDPYKIFRFR